MKTIGSLISLAAAVLIAWSNFNIGFARADSFGSGPNAFNIDFVTVGNPGNPPDTTGNPNPAGSVAYKYRIARYEISGQMIDKANAEGGLGIMHFAGGPNAPAYAMTWFEAAKFVNWLNTATGNAPAYKFESGGNFELWAPSDAGYDPTNLYRNTRAKYVLPSDDEWYKAAYYNPTLGIYYDYPTGSDSIPDGIDFPGDPNFDAVFYDGAVNEHSNDINNVGVLSPYGTAGQGGSVDEWEETEYDLVNNAVDYGRGARGGNWDSPAQDMLSTGVRFNTSPVVRGAYLGFRVASVALPEPSALLLAAMATIGMTVRWAIRRKRSQ